MSNKNKEKNQSFYNQMLGHLNEAEYEELRALILGLGPEELQKLRIWLTDPDKFAEDIGDIIPLAIKQLIEKRIILPESLLSLVEEAIHRSVIENPQKLANALFPIMGPAIRKAVAEDIKKMVDSLNNTLEHSFSPKRLTWRFQSLISGRSYAEIVLSNALIYRVRQVFLIHRQTGILLQHVVDEQSDFRDPDLVSSMLKAINDFVNDSFQMDEKADLETIKVGGYTVWIEPGPYAIIAGVVEGNPPNELRDVFKQANEKIHLDLSRQLIHFDGDMAPFEQDDGQLKICLQKQQKQTKKKKPIIIIIILVVLLGLLGYWIYFSLEERNRWNQYLANLTTRPGIVITETGNKDGLRYIKGLRDPLAVSPASLLALYGFDSSEVNSQWKYYYALDSSFILQRINRRLKTPSTARLSLRNGVLYLQGTASPAWIEKAVSMGSSTWGIQQVNTGNLNIDTDQRIKELTRLIENHVFFFPYEIVAVDQDQQQSFDSLQSEINELNVIAGNHYNLKVEIHGHTTTVGNLEGNKNLIDRRARYIKSLLNENAVPDDILEKIIHIYDTDQLPDHISPRSVTFRVELNKKES